MGWLDDVEHFFGVGGGESGGKGQGQEQDNAAAEAQRSVKQLELDRVKQDLAGIEKQLQQREAAAKQGLSDALTKVGQEYDKKAQEADKKANAAKAAHDAALNKKGGSTQSILDGQRAEAQASEGTDQAKEDKKKWDAKKAGLAAQIQAAHVDKNSGDISSFQAVASDSDIAKQFKGHWLADLQQTCGDLREWRGKRDRLEQEIKNLGKGQGKEH